MTTETPVGSARKIDRGDAEVCPVRVDDAGVWHVNDFGTVRAVLRSTDTRQAGFGVETIRRPPGMRPAVLYRDGPEHREHRRQTARYFTPRRVDEKYRGLMHRYADEQCDRLRQQGRADLSDLSFALAVAVAGAVIGLTPARPGMARRLDRFFTESPVVPGWTSPARIAHLIDRNFTIGSFYVCDVRPAIAARRKERQDDLISHLLDEGCTNLEILGECVTFAAAGMITTREFIAVAAWHLFTDDALREAYVSGDEPARLAILHEILRLEPVVSTLARRTTADIAIPGATIPAGARVDLCVGTANLDPGVVGPDPARLCPGRALPEDAARSMLAFGDGPHRCPGAHVAIQETEIFLTKLFALPNLRLVSTPRVRLRAVINSYELIGTIVAVD
jgi:cytochrome P450